LEWKIKERAYEQERLQKQFDRARELHQAGFLAIDSWLAKNNPKWLTPEDNTNLRNKAILIYIAEDNAQFMRAFQAIGAGDWFNIGRIAFSMKDYNTAATAFGMSSKLSRGSVLSDYWRIKALASVYYIQPNDVKARIALTAYNDFISANPTYYPAYYDRAELLSRVDRIKESISDYKFAISHNIRILDAHVELGFLMLRISDRAAADRYFRQALHIDPQNQLAKDGLASLRQGGQSYSQAEQDSGSFGSYKYWQKVDEENRARNNEMLQRMNNLVRCGNEYGLNCPF
jgi:tetratricopeptide (TPR) repeat protein